MPRSPKLHRSMFERDLQSMSEFTGIDLGNLVQLPKVQTVISTDASTNKSILILALSLAAAGVLIAAVAKK